MSVDGWVVLVIFLSTYIMIFTDWIPRTTASLTGALVVMGYGMYRGFLTESSSIEFIKFDVIILLMSMGIIVNILLNTGFFGYVAIKLAQISKGNVGNLVLLLGLGTAFLSMIVNNVTTIIILIPITIEIAKKLEINPVPLLLGEAILSNIGGVGTIVGDPPNIIISSYSSFTFNDFLFHMLPPVVMASILTALLIKYVYRDCTCRNGHCHEDILTMNAKDEITDFLTMKKTLMVLTGVFFLFIFHDMIGISPAFAALVGAGATLLVNYYDPEKVLKNVEWSVLLFFASLFVLVGAMNSVGILKEVAEWTVNLAGNNEMLAVIIVLWVTAIATGFVDNIPFTAAMAPVIIHMKEVGDMNITPLWWALALGVGFGGNLTPIGSSSGVVTVGIASKYGYDINMKEWMKIGVPASLLSLMVATLFIIAFWGFYT